MSPHAPTQAARWPLHPTKVVSRRDGSRRSALGYQAQSRAEVWSTVKRGTEERSTHGDRKPSPSSPALFPKGIYTYHPQTVTKLNNLEEKTSNTLTMKKLATLELTLLWSPPVTRPVHSHRACQGPTQTYMGSQASSGIWRKHHKRQELKISKQIKCNVEETEIIQGIEGNKSQNKQKP